MCVGRIQCSSAGEDESLCAQLGCNWSNLFNDGVEECQGPSTNACDILDQEDECETYGCEIFDTEALTYGDRILVALGSAGLALLLAMLFMSCKIMNQTAGERAAKAVRNPEPQVDEQETDEEPEAAP